MTRGGWGRRGAALLVVAALAVVAVSAASAATGGPTGAPHAGDAFQPGADGADARVGLANTTAPADESAPDDGSREEATGAAFAVSGLENRALTILNARSGPSGATPRDTTVTLTVRNTGDRAGSTWVELFLRREGETDVGSPIERTRVSLDPDEATTITFRPLALYEVGPGNHTLRVRAGDAVDESRFGIYFPRYTYFRLGTVDDVTVRPGESATLSVRVENTGRPPGVHRSSIRSPGLAAVSASVNGTVVDAEAVWLDVGESTTVELAIPSDALAPGVNRVVIVSTAEGDRRLDSQVRPAVTLQSTSDGGNGPGFGLLVSALALALAAILLARRS